uniref:Uncharacterized protein n=1 Tax=Timema cristinae TaxID=61476 RepID=A0A7R9DA82_TIMCR|nr:unnamed protein product [Timema cristinae]
MTGKGLVFANSGQPIPSSAGGCPLETSPDPARTQNIKARVRGRIKTVVTRKGNKQLKNHWVYKRGLEGGSGQSAVGGDPNILAKQGMDIVLISRNLSKLEAVSEAIEKTHQMLIPNMYDKQKGVIINISSTAALIPSPMLTVYAASKAYIEKFSTDLQIEYEKHGIVIQCVMPGYVATKMSKIKRSTWMAPSPDRFVKKALLTTGTYE